MKKLLAFIRDSYRYMAPIPANSSTFQDSRIITFPSLYYSFNGPGISTKYIPSEAEIISISEGNQVKDKDSGEKEILNTFWKGQNEDQIRLKEISSKNRSIWVWIASTSIILIFAFAIIHNHIRNREIERIFRAYYFLPEISTVTMGNTAIANNPVWKPIERAYKQKNFTLVREIRRALPVQSPIYDYTTFLSSICLIQDHQYQRALERFISLKENVGFISAVRFYEGLCYLKLGNIHSARLIFGNINDNSIYAKKASEILRNIKVVD